VKAEPFIRRLFGPFEHQIGEKYRSIFIDMDVFKDWERNSSPIHWLCDAWDRWLTGDRVSYMTFLEMREIDTRFRKRGTRRSENRTLGEQRGSPGAILIVVIDFPYRQK
jgi:hypothetical protein